MPTIRYQGVNHEIHAGETVLDCLLRNNHSIPNSCRAGACRSCLMKSSNGSLPSESQIGLKETEKAAGFFLACVCRPTNDLEIGDPGSEIRKPASIAGLDMISKTVMRVKITRPDGFSYRPGQYVTLITPDGLARSYSLASLPEEDMLELHVRIIPNGKMSDWLRTEARIGTEVSVQGPSGECYYLPSNLEQPILMAGTGTGLSPLFGIARDSLRQQHNGPIWFFHGALTPEGLYFKNELRELVRQHANFNYCPNVLEGNSSPGVEIGPMDQIVLRRFPKLGGWKAFVCGDPDFVQFMKRKLFLAGMMLKEIHSDAFLPSGKA